MRKWKCVDTKRETLTVGKIYVTDDDGYGLLDDNGKPYSSLVKVQYYDASKFIEVKDFTKSDLQECDVVIFRNKERRVYFDDAFLSRYNADKCMAYYGDNLVRNDETNKYDVMQVYRNGILIFDRVEEPIKSPIQIEIESIEEEQRKLADRLSELRKGL